MKANVPSISAGNSKIGKIPNINLPPPVTCYGLPCLKEGCYGLKSYRLFPSCRQSWMHNYETYMNDPKAFFDKIIGLLSRKRNAIPYFRWHAIGEIPNQEYLNGMKRVAKAFPETRFLCFTKRYAYDFSGTPKNLRIVFSTWPGMELPDELHEKYPIAWMNDGTQDDRIKEKGKKTVECSGSCVKCKRCWHMKTTDVVFHKH